MTNLQHEALVEAVARAIRPVLEGDSEIYWASEYGRPTPQASLDAIARAAIAALSAASAATQETAACAGCEGRPAPENNPCAVCGATAATPSGEEVRLREALNQIAFLSTNHGGWFETDPWGSYAELGDLARAALVPQAKDL